MIDWMKQRKNWDDKWMIVWMEVGDTFEWMKE